ncbi:hypothetical protein [Halovivax sp.]|uniref:hypothetical protein n=1 Tax=Halovivax sp. TaxID=1935978 RepID=UPI0025BC05D3|nr:hypothetical protein [Halovivax sp.]
MGRATETTPSGPSRDAGTSADADTVDALETPRERYVRGEIGEAESKRRVDRLLDTDPGKSGLRR